MPRKRCQTCVGSGKVMGGGMMLQDCPHCEGVGKLDEPENEIEFLMTKDNPRYIEAKEKIKRLDDTLTDEAAEKMLDDELNNTRDRELKTVCEERENA